MLAALAFDAEGGSAFEVAKFFEVAQFQDFAVCFRHIGEGFAQQVVFFGLRQAAARGGYAVCQDVPAGGDGAVIIPGAVHLDFLEHVPLLAGEIFALKVGDGLDEDGAEFDEGWDVIVAAQGLKPFAGGEKDFLEEVIDRQPTQEHRIDFELGDAAEPFAVVLERLASQFKSLDQCRSLRSRR